MPECLKVLSAGVGLSLQDAGRGGWRRYGVPPGGVMDRHAMRAANALLGNRLEAPVLECLMRGQRLEVLTDTWLAFAGARMAVFPAAWTAEFVTAGSIVDCSATGDGLWGYLAVPGGFASTKWLGSASMDTRIGFGEVIRPGTVLASRAAMPKHTFPRVVRRRSSPGTERFYGVQHRFELLPGPQFESFDAEVRRELVTATWTVSARSDRTGYRLEGPALDIPASIPSDPVLPGTFQITGSGQPIITLRDGPTVGGYPKLAVLQETDLDRLAQCRPGTQLRFQWTHLH